MEKRLRRAFCFWFTWAAAAGLLAQTREQTTAGDRAPTLQLKVRRVLLDVVVTNSQGLPVKGLTAADFKVFENGRSQKIVSFDANGFSGGMDYVPPALLAEPANTFVDLPHEAEKGPLYVLLLDLVNMDSPDQMNSPMDHSTQLFARRELVNFIESKPEGTRFAVFVRTNGLHLVQGFTSDKAKLERAIDPHHPRRYLPAVFLSGENFGRGDRISAMNTLHAIAAYLNGLPGRKNLIWYSAQFPLSLYDDETDDARFREETKATLDLLAQDQIALYPVDARGVPYGDSHTQLTTSVHSDTITSPAESGSGASASSGATGPVGNSPSTTSSFVQGNSTVMGGYSTMDGIARATGGKAFYGDNDVAMELLKATESGGMYYTIGYSPADPKDDGKLRSIRVELTRDKGDQLSYRRFYYRLMLPESVNEREAQGAVGGGTTQAALGRKPGDLLSAIMQYGAPEEHQLIFVVKARAAGPPAPGTAQQMAELAAEPAVLASGKKPAEGLAPMLLQKDVFEVEVPREQFANETALHLEVAAAAYDADGNVMNAFVRVAQKDLEEGPKPPPLLRIEQELEVPVAATSLRFAVRDDTNDRLGALVVKLPLAKVKAER